MSCLSCLACIHCISRTQVSDVDKLAFITEVQCLVCGESLPTVCRRSKYYLENIDDPSVLQRGDHVGWYRALAYWHHGIVTRQGADSVYVVGYTVSNPDHPGATVTEKEYGHRSMVSLMRGNVYRIVYDDCFTNEYTALRAQRTLGEQKYDFFEQNCEHSTYWSKTGLHGSNQIESGFVSLGMVMLGILLRVAVLSVLWLLQICRLTQTGTESGEGLWVERGVNIAYVTIVVTIFSAYSIYKGSSSHEQITSQSFNAVKPVGGLQRLDFSRNPMQRHEGFFLLQTDRNIIFLYSVKMHEKIDIFCVELHTNSTHMLRIGVVK